MPQLPSLLEIRLVAPEIALIVGMCAVIMVPLIRRRSVAWIAGTAIAALLVALIAALLSLGHLGAAGQVVLSGMLAIDRFSQSFKLLLLVFTLLVVVQWLIAARQQSSILDHPDFLCLLLGATMGMALMASATNLVMIFIATESASLPSYALAGFRKRHRIGTEGSLKYVLFGAASSAVMLYGMSLLYGSCGSLDLSRIAQAAAPTLAPDAAGHWMAVSHVTPLFAVGLTAFFVGIAFKLSAVPLHFWCPDVFQGAPTEVTTFLSVASKGAAVCLLLRVLLAFGDAAGPVGVQLAAHQLAFTPFAGLGIGVAILGAVTATWGNLVAFHQNNIKRLLAYSSIAHAGYMIMGASVMVLARPTDGNPGGLSATVAGAILFYLLVYLFMNMGAFTVAALVAQSTGSEDIRDYTGLGRRSPLLAVCLALFLLSLFGMPGLGGFMAKVGLMAAMTDRRVGAIGLALVAVLLLNTALSLYYYLRPVRAMFFAADEENRPAFLPRGAGVGLLLTCVVALLWTGLYPISTADLSKMVVHNPASPPGLAPTAPVSLNVSPSPNPQP